MKTYHIYASQTVEYVAVKEFATEAEATAWAENQCEAVDLDQSVDWDYRESSTEWWDVHEASEDAA